MRSGEVSPGAHSVGEMLAAQPEVLLLIVDLAGAEGRKKRPDAAMHHAYSMPNELQLSLLEGLVLADDPSLREAAIGWLLAESAIATPMASMVEEAAGRGLVSATSVTNLMLIRNWVPEDRRRAIDAIVKAARAVESAPEKRLAIQVREL